jgi:hypothetical protein
VVARTPSFTPVLRADADARAALTAWLKPFGVAPSLADPVEQWEPVAA